MKRLADQTHYEILEVRHDAREAEIESAYERARALYGPGSLATYTLMSPDEAALLTSRIEEARRTLLDPEARARYDAELDEEPRQKKGAVSSVPPATALFGPVPPVIPALQPRPPRQEPEAKDEPPAPAEDERRADPVASVFQAPPAKEPPVASPVLLLAAAVDAAGPAADRAAPILLKNEVPAPVPRPVSTPVPTSTPVPASTPAPAASAPDVPIPDGAVWTGEALRKVREARGITIHQIAERTKVTRHHVENIEADRFGTLPAGVYLRGILLSLARELRLDGQKVARSYLERVAAATGAGKPR